MASGKVENINPDILIKCREQMGLSIDEAQKKTFQTLSKMEAGTVKPTFNQLEKLADVYCVPQWVFIKEELPRRYNYNGYMISFRLFNNGKKEKFDYKTRKITANVERFRELILELREDMGEPIDEFSPPMFQQDIIRLAQAVRKWLGCENFAYEFKEWKTAVEKREIFVFSTGKLSNWAKSEQETFRGFAVYNDTLPIIVINDSDAIVAQSFTLFHELGHLIKKESVLDTKSEKWCERFAAEVLMPDNHFLPEAAPLRFTGNVQEDIKSIDRLAGKFKVSSYACSVKMRQLNKITEENYQDIVDILKERWRVSKEKQRQGDTQTFRDMAMEKLNQYGNIYAKAVVQAYHNEEIGLHKLCKLFDIKKTKDALKLQGML